MTDIDRPGPRPRGPGRAYALLVAPSSNRVYADAAIRLGQAELEILGATLGEPLSDIGERRIAGVPYHVFRGVPDEQDLARLANLSSAYALFEIEEGGLLRPVELRPLARYDDDLVTIPKYAGKTNEQFTKLLLNITLAATDRDPTTDRITVLDPLCGRGTTLNQAMMYGYDALGIERDGNHVDAYVAFLRAYLRRKRIKHQAGGAPVRRDRRLVARRFEATVERTQRVVIYHADTLTARNFLRAGCADVIVGDLPYGVAHGRREGPAELLRAALPVWNELLRAGGALGLAWNTYLARRSELAEILAGAGLIVRDEGPYRALEHRVDQAIVRDVLVAGKRPRARGRADGADAEPGTPGRVTAPGAGPVTAEDMG